MARAAREHFRGHGIEIQETGPIPHDNRFFVHDPDGNRIELIQWIEPYDPVASGADQLGWRAEKLAARRRVADV